jgi:hypothetical protein
MDFVDDLVDGRPALVVPALLDALDRLTSPGGSRDYTVSVQGVAAAALLAGYAPEDKRRSEWFGATIPPLAPEVAMLACQAVDVAYGDDAILTEFAAEAGSLPEQFAAIEPLRRRLRAAIPPPQTETLF